MEHMRTAFEATIYPILCSQMIGIFQKIPDSVLEKITEVRMRVAQPLLLMLGTWDVMVDACGQIINDTRQAYLCSVEDIVQTLQLISQNSLYAFERELRMGFITIAGGHRVGLAGQAVTDDGKIKYLKNISSMNIRLAREVKGCANIIIPYISSGHRIMSTLLISPPRCGKTTVLRDIVRLASGGSASSNLRGMQVGVVDERSEIAACANGIPTVDLGRRVDVLDGCPKASGMLMLIRSMAPQVVVTDELGRDEDVYAIQEALHAGVSVITSVHGRNADDVIHRPYIGDLIRCKYFERYVILSDNPTPGTVEEIISVQNGEVLYNRKKGVKVCG